MTNEYKTPLTVQKFLDDYELIRQLNELRLLAKLPTFKQSHIGWKQYEPTKDTTRKIKDSSQVGEGEGNT